MDIQKQKEEQRLSEEESQKKAKKLEPKMQTTKPKAVKKKKNRDKTSIETAFYPDRYNQSHNFDSPSELFKKRKASRDRVKHPRY